MIDIASGADIDRLLDGIVQHPRRYASVTLCSPFIDEKMVERVLPFFAAARQHGCRIRVITSREGANKVRKFPDSQFIDRSNRLIASDKLHAKIYLAVARHHNDTEAIVTSANLTSAGIFANIELGVRVRPTTKLGHRLMNQVHHFVDRLATSI